ncbi:MAG: hypothetical protein M3R17_12340 [Bacteroidota bacterium]|nr:hypothetical protein [Bacteroidota bacterium]
MNLIYHIKLACITAIFLLLPFKGWSASKTWIATTASNWTTAASWSTGTIPTSNDTVFFDGTSNGNCTMPGTTVTIQRFYIQGYTGTITLSANLNLSSTTRSFTQTTGTFSIIAPASSTIVCAVSGNFNKTGGTFSCSNVAGTTINVNVGGDMISSAGTFTAGNSTFKLLKGGAPTMTGSPAFFNLSFNPATAVTWTIGASPTVSGLLQYLGSVTITLNGGSLSATGDITIASTLPSGGGGTTNLNMNGGGTQTLTGSAAAGNGRLPHVNITCGTLRIAGTPSVAGNWIYTSGTVDANYLSANSTVVMCGTGDIDGQGTSATMAFQNITIFASGTTPTRKLAGNLSVNGNLAINSGITFATGIASSVAFNSTIQGKWTNSGTFTQIASPSCTVTFEGSNYSDVSKSAATESFTNLTINKSANGVKLTGPVNVTGTLTLTAGKVKTTSTNILGLTAGAAVSGGSDNAYVNGPMVKTGNTAFVFPTGDSVKSTPYHPLGITAPATVTDAYIAQYKGTGQTSGSAIASTLSSINACEHWTLQRSAPASGTTTITPTLYWNTVCANANYAEMSIAAWNGTQWIDQGAGTLTANSPGSLAASTSVSFTNTTTVVPLVIAKTTVVQSYATLSDQPTGGYYNTNGNILYFRYEEEYKDANGFISYQVINPATNTAVTLLSNSTTTNIPVAYGTNSYKMDLYTAANTPLAAGTYILLVTNDKNETFQLMFNKN